MSSIKLTGDTSGEITISAPAVAGTNTLTLPANTGTIVTSESGAGDLPSTIAGPAFRAYQTSGQTLTDNAFTKITHTTENFDTNSNYDTSTSKFTPTVAGYYQINAGVVITGSISRTLIELYKNGSGYARGNDHRVNTAVSTGRATINDIVYFNGSTDYVEVYVYSSGTGRATATGSNETWFSGCLVRAA